MSCSYPLLRVDDDASDHILVPDTAILVADDVVFPGMPEGIGHRPDDARDSRHVDAGARHLKSVKHIGASDVESDRGTLRHVQRARCPGPHVSQHMYRID